MAKCALPLKSFGIALIVTGLGLAFWGYRLSDSVTSQITQAVTGSDTDRVMMFLSGAVCFVVGIFLSVKS